VNKRNVIEKSRKFATPFRITNGEKFRLKHIDPAETLGLQVEDEPRTKKELVIGIQALAELQDRLLRAGQVGRARDFSGYGCRRQGWRHQACHVRRQP
jgi:hypothetical protein